jgi:cation:H+ antiporter
MLAAYVVACLLGLGLLARAADALVLGSSALARRAGVPAVVVGVVLIGFGTSTPELLASSLAAAAGSAGIALGTVIGSNVVNVTLVLGSAALAAPLFVQARVIRREVPLALLACAAFGLAVQNGLTRVDGLALLAGLVGCLGLLLWWALRSAAAPDAAVEPEVEELLGERRHEPTRRLLLRAGLGLLGTLAGAQGLIWGAIGLADRLALSEGFVGVVVVAVGTSLPELVTSVQAARRGESELVIGNLMGSNIFNALGVGGLAGVIGTDGPVSAGLTGSGVLAMLAGSALAAAVMARGMRVVRWEAAVLIAAFVLWLPLLGAT